MKNSNTFATIVAFLVAFGTIITEEFTKAFWFMSALIIISTILDLLQPKVAGKSRVAWVKKALPFLVLIVCYIADVYFESEPAMVSLFESSVIISEFAYILKSISALGYPVPKFILDRLNASNDKLSAVVVSEIMNAAEDALDGNGAEIAQKDAEKSAE